MATPLRFTTPHHAEDQPHRPAGLHGKSSGLTYNRLFQQLNGLVDAPAPVANTAPKRAI